MGYGNITTSAVLKFYKPLFQFVDSRLGAGHNILIHCLAGAHRAGTAGISCLMYLCELDPATATTLAKRARPAIDPIGHFPQLLELLGRALDSA